MPGESNNEGFFIDPEEMVWDTKKGIPAPESDVTESPEEFILRTEREKARELAKKYVVTKDIEKMSAKRTGYHNVDSDGLVKAKDPNFGMPNPQNYESDNKDPWYESDLS